MKNLFAFCLTVFLSPVLLMAQLDDNGSLFSDDLLLKVTPGDAGFHAVGTDNCDSVRFEIYNIGAEELTISGFYIEDILGVGFKLGTLNRRPIKLNPDEFFAVRVDFCPEGIGLYESELIVEYGTGKVLTIPCEGSSGKIYDMDWCEDFNDWPTGSGIGNGWTVSTTGPGYPFVSSFYFNYKQRIQESRLIFLLSLGDPVSTEATTVGIRVSGQTPVISWTEFTVENSETSQANLLISTDGHNWGVVDTYLMSELPYLHSQESEDWFKKRIYSLEDYIGQTIWWRFEFANNYTHPYGECCDNDYWVIDDLCVQQGIASPELQHYPKEIDLRGVFVGDSITQSIRFINDGGSITKINTIQLVDYNNEWSLLDTNDYPVEIHDGFNYAFAENGTETMLVDVTFAPKDIGLSTAKLVITWGLDEEKIYEIPLNGYGSNCLMAEEAHIGENWAASQDSWFFYTADRYQVVNINSCHPNQDISNTYEFDYDTYLQVFESCTGDLSFDNNNENLIAQNDDLEWDGCPYNLHSSGVQFAMKAGETVFIYWPWYWRSYHDDEGFFFNIEQTFPIDGDVCELAIPLTLPVVNHLGTTRGFKDDYDTSPCSPWSNYMDGNDKVYTITLDHDGYLNGSIIGLYGSIHILDQCPDEEFDRSNCIAYASGPDGGEFEEFIEAGTYYVLISSWAPPQTVDYLLNLSFQGLSIDDDEHHSFLKIYPNPTNGRFTISFYNKDVRDITLEMIDISGQVVYRNQVKSVYNYTEEIDTSSFAKGIYYLRVNDVEDVRIEKVIIQ